MAAGGLGQAVYNHSMRDLSTIRRVGDDVEAEETRLLRGMTIAEGVKAFALLYDAYALRFRAEEPAYLTEREAALIERQRRLVRLRDWLNAHPDRGQAVES